MWKQERSNHLKRILVISEISLIAMVVLFFVKFLWDNTEIANVDKSIQAMFIGLCCLLVVFAVNHVLDRRW